LIGFDIVLGKGLNIANTTIRRKDEE